MNRGCYRFYFHIGNLGFKIPRICFYNANPFCGFLCGCIMNMLEWKRYRYYVKGKKFKQWGNKWQYNGVKPIFCPVYFSCGLLSIVKHIPYKVSYEDKIRYVKKQIRKNKNIQTYIDKVFDEKTAYLCNKDMKEENFRKDDNGKIYCIDYGDFTLGNHNRTCGCLIDYK